MAKTINPFDNSANFAGPSGNPATPPSGGPGSPAASGMPFGAPDFMKGKKFTADDAASASDTLPIGRHLAAIRKVTSDRVSRAGNPMIVFTLEVIDGPAAGKEKDYFYTVTDKTLWLIPELGAALGLPGPWGVDDFTNSVGTIVIIDVVEGQEYQGRPQTNINRFHSPAEAGITAGTRHAKGTPLVR